MHLSVSKKQIEQVISCCQAAKNISGDILIWVKTNSNLDKNIQTPTSSTQIKSLLGMTNFCNRLIPNYSTLIEPLRNITQKDTAFTWDTQHQKLSIH